MLGSFEYYGEAGSPKKVKPNGFIFRENWPFGPVSFAKAALSHETCIFFLFSSFWMIVRLQKFRAVSRTQQIYARQTGQEVSTIV